MRRLALITLLASGLGCVDGDALRRGLQGERPPVPLDLALDADRPDDASLPPDRGPLVDMAPPVDMAPDPRCVPETCNDLDDDCDGSVDEAVADCCVPGTRRDCGQDVGVCTVGEQFCTIDLEWSACTGAPPGREICDGATDEDCDGRVDEQVTNACGACGPAPTEACNGQDDDCDGAIDEGLLNACGDCGDAPRERCNGRDDDCDGQIDEGQLNACGACGAVPAEACNGVDDDCDGQIDEGALNACGACGPPPAEQCNGADDDCDGQIDEGALNACGACGPPPAEQCNGADDDCDGQIDEGVLNACGACGEPPVELCDGVDNDCDDQVDERACYAFVLDDLDGVWRAPPGLNSSPLITDRQVTAAFATARGGGQIWVVVGDDIHGYLVGQDRWTGVHLRDVFGLARVDAAYAVPAWANGLQNSSAVVTVSSGPDYKIFEFNALTHQTSFVRQGSHAAEWADDPRAPRSFPLEATVLDLFDNQNFWPGDFNQICGDGEAGAVGGVLTAGRLYTADASACFLFMDQQVVGDWAGFRRPNAPPPEQIVAWAHLNRPTRTGVHVVILSAPVDGPR